MSATRNIKDLFTRDKAFANLIEAGYPFRETEIENASKMLACGTAYLSSATYKCENSDCTHTKTIRFTCKSRFCASCGQKATEKWMCEQGEMLPDCEWLHTTFTMPDTLWMLFLLNRHLLGALFPAASEGLTGISESKKLTIGIFSALHTYGRRLNPNVHFHICSSSGGLNEHGTWKPFSFKATSLMPQWRYAVIKLLRDDYESLIFPPELEKESTNYDSWNAFLDREYRKHWNVHTDKATDDKHRTKKYIGRYLKKPPISNSRLKHYSGGDVTFRYLDHNTGKHEIEHLSQEEMIIRLLLHVPEKFFNMIRYYGFLSTRTRSKYLPIIYEHFNQSVSAVSNLSYASMMKGFLNIDPFKCILCGSRMVFKRFNKGLSVKQLRSEVLCIAKLKIISM
jgi:hypothetical protein